MYIWMELNNVNIREMASKDSQGNVLLCLPKFRCAIIWAWNKVVAKGWELQVPNRITMAMENTHQGLILQWPKSDGIILRCWDELLVINLNTHCIDRAGMTDKDEAFILSFPLFIFLSIFEVYNSSLWINNFAAISSLGTTCWSTFLIYSLSCLSLLCLQHLLLFMQINISCSHEISLVLRVNKVKDLNKAILETTN